MTPACWICGAVLDAGGYEPSGAGGLPELRSKKSAATNVRSFCACGDAWCRWNGHSVQGARHATGAIRCAQIVAQGS